MGTRVGVTTVKQFSYRGDALEEYSNTYWFTFSSPAGDVEWKALSDALIAEERKVYVADVKVIRAYGYNSDADDAVAVWSYDYLLNAATVAGNLSVGTTVVMPGDAACWLRWSTSKLNTKGRRIYLRKYFHPALQEGTTVALRDKVGPGQRAALEQFGTKLIDGSFIGGRTLCPRKYDTTVSAPASSPYITTRTLKRRGKRPNS